MNIVLQTKDLMLTMGAAPIMYLMILLSIVSIAIMLERAWFFWRIADDYAALAQRLEAHLLQSDIEGARNCLRASPAAEAAVVLAGLNRAAHGIRTVQDAMQSTAAAQRHKLERGLGFLGTLGNNAPFIGLFGTVVGVIMAFDELGQAGKMAGASASVMSSIAEALVATAIGLAVAIPAVVAYNHFQRRIRAVAANTEALSHVLLGWLNSHSASTDGRGPSSPPLGGRESVATAPLSNAAVMVHALAREV